MDIKDFAKLLNNRQYGNEITTEEEKLAKDLGLVVVFGYSDDCTELRGAIYDEVSTYGGRDVYISKEGLFEQCNCNCKHSKLAKDKCNIIKARYGKEYYWEFNVDVPYECFSILEDDDKYCKGIVFRLIDLN